MITKDDYLDIIINNPEMELDHMFTAITAIKNKAGVITRDGLIKELNELGLNIRDDEKLDDYPLDYVEIKFLQRYIVMNYWLPEHIGGGIPESEVKDFKSYLLDRACKDVFNKIVDEEYLQFKQSNSKSK
jgi:hypothetical protein